MGVTEDGFPKGNSDSFNSFVALEAARQRLRSCVKDCSNDSRKNAPSLE